LPNEIVEKVIKEVNFDMVGVYGKYMKFERDFNGDRHYVFINSIGLNDKKDDEIQAVIAHEIAHYIKGHHGFIFDKIPQEIEDEADKLAISWGFDRSALERLKNDYHEVYYIECENCNKSINFELTYFNTKKEQRECHNCIKESINSGLKAEDMFLDYDLMRFNYNDKKI